MRISKQNNRINQFSTISTIIIINLQKKFIYDNFSYINFQHYQLLNKPYKQKIMISKIFSSPLYFLLQQKPLCLSTKFLYSSNQNQRRQSHPLRSKIMDLSSFDTFRQFFNNKKDQFDPSCYAIASRTLAKIIVDQRPQFYPEHRQLLKKFLDNLSALNYDNLNHTELSHALYLLRILKNDQTNNNYFIYNYIRSILSRAENKFKQLQTDSSFNRLCYYYQQLNTLKMRNTNAITKRLCALLQNGQNTDTDSPMYLSVSDMTLLLKGMRSKDQLSMQDIQLFKILIDNVMNKHIGNISFFELAQISVGLNQVIQKNQSMRIGDYLSKVEQIHKKVLSNIDEMDQKSIMYILGSVRTRNQTFIKIYKTIFDKIFDQITPNGESSFNQMFTLRLFAGISNKLRLSTATEENQQKFFVFFKNTILKTPRYCNSFVEQYVERNFFNNKQLNKLTSILELIPDFHPKLSLLYELSKRGANVEKIMSFDRPTLQLKKQSLLLLAGIMQNQLRRTKQQIHQQKYLQILNKCKQRFISLYKADDGSFAKLVQNLNDKYLQCLSTMSKQLLNNYPNPYETQQSAQYRRAWLRAMVCSQNQNQFAKTVMPKIFDKITQVEDLQNVLKFIINSNVQYRYAITNSLTLLLKTLNLFVAKPQTLNGLFSYIQGKTQLILQQKAHSWENAQNRYWYLVSQLMTKLPVQMFFKNGSQLVRKIIRLQSPQTFYSQKYLSFLEKLVKANSKITGSLASQIIAQALRVNLINRQLAKQITQQSKKGLRFYQRTMLRCIQKSQFALQGVQLKKENLFLFLFNNCPQIGKIIKQNQQKMIKMIEQMKFNQLWNCITHYRLGSKKYSVALIQKLFECLNQNFIQFQKYNPSFVTTVLRKNNLHQTGAKTQNIRAYLRKSLEYFTSERNCDKISMESHISLLKDTNDFRVKNDDYCHLLIKKLHVQNASLSRQLYLTLANIGFQFSSDQIAKLEKRDLFTYNPTGIGKNFNIFIIIEQQLQNPKEVLSKLIQKYNKWKPTQKMNIHELNYQYLKKKYPEQTKDFQPNSIQKIDLCKSIEQDAQSIVTRLRSVLEEVCKVNFVEANLCGNYYYTFRNVLLTFPQSTKNHGQNNALRKMFECLIDSSKVVIINRKATSIKSIAKYLISNNPQLVSSPQQEQIFKRIDQLFEQSRAKRQAKTQAAEAQAQQAEVEVQEEVEGNKKAN